MKRQRRLALLLAIVALCFALITLEEWVRLGNQARFEDVGDRLRTALEADGRFNAVHVDVSTQPRVYVTAPSDLPYRARSDLEHITRVVSGRVDVHIMYVAPIPHPRPTASPNQ